MEAQKFILIPISDHITVDEANEFAQEINEQFQPHRDAYVALLATPVRQYTLAPSA